MPQSTTTTAAPAEQRDALLDAQRNANQSQPRNFKEDALADKVVTVAPDGTGPTPTETFDPAVDQALGSGNDADSASGSQTGAAKRTGQPNQGKTARD